MHFSGVAQDRGINHIIILSSELYFELTCRSERATPLPVPVSSSTRVPVLYRSQEWSSIHSCVRLYDRDREIPR